MSRYSAYNGTAISVCNRVNQSLQPLNSNHMLKNIILKFLKPSIIKACNTYITEKCIESHVWPYDSSIFGKAIGAHSMALRICDVINIEYSAICNPEEVMARLRKEGKNV